jgi:hypothetical protein
MKEGISIRGWFGDWCNVTREEALSYARTLYRRMTTGDRVSLVSKHIRGVQFTKDELECQ